MLDLYQVFLMDDDILFPVLYPTVESTDPTIAVSLVDGKVKDVPYTESLTDLTLDLMADCTEDFDLIIRAVEKLKASTIAITGLARSGKDTLCDVLLEELPTFRKVALGDALRSVRKIVYGESDRKDRHELIQIGQGLRKTDERIWIKAWLRIALNRLAAGAYGIVVTDVRQQNEFNYFNQFATTVHVSVSEEVRLQVLAETDGTGALDDQLLKNETEQYTEFFRDDCTYHLVNNYDDEFYEAVRELATVIKGTKNA